MRRRITYYGVPIPDAKQEIERLSLTRESRPHDKAHAMVERAIREEYDACGTLNMGRRYR